jgi:ribosomal protein S18 acetylase RimI-like enzyme
MIRPAEINDLNTLIDIENRCFETDRITRRSFRHLLTRGNAETLVEEIDGKIAGYVMVLFHTGTLLARLYSLAVNPQFQNRGVGGRLIAAAEQEVTNYDCITMRLEIRKDNQASINLFKKCKYRQFDILLDYYEDHMDALRFEKVLVPHLRPDLTKVPYYEQTLEFTCGPSALMMAMKALDSIVELSRTLELRIWRESTTIFMTSGHGGCGPHGLALAAYKRGFDVEIYVSETGPLLLDSVRSEDKKEVIRLVHEDFVDELQGLPIPIIQGSLSVSELKDKFDQGEIPIVLISSYRIYHEKSPHWVVLTGIDERYIYVHDSLVDYEEGKNAWDCTNLPIMRREFEKMARYGRAAQKAVIVIKKRTAGGKAK